MSAGKRSGLLAHFPLSTWPKIDISVLEPLEKTALVERRMRALNLYSEGAPHKAIHDATGVTRFDLRRLLHRCTALHDDGQIQGFRALIPGKRVARYVRSAPVCRERGSGSGGCAGALQQLFSRFPALQHMVDQEFLRVHPKKKSEDVRIRTIDLHAKFITWLREQKVSDDEWPFNTSNEGQESLRRYCRQLLTAQPDRWLAARSGEAAARRNRLGTGVPRTFPSLRPFGAVQLDFHKVDAASTIAIENSFGVEVEIPLARWHIGLLFEEKLELILGAVIALEITPSSDSVLETIESALSPIIENPHASALAIGMGSKVFPNQLFEQLKGQCFSVLRMDNGWSNTAVDVINNVVDIVGCAVNFGPVRSWWGRDAIERVFGQMTRESLQRSPSTYGANSQDSRRTRPNAQAERLRIRLSDLVGAFERVIANHNATRTEALSMSSPLSALEAAMNNPRSLFIPAPLPRSQQEFPSVLFKTVLVTVRGNLKIGERPYVKIGRWRYTNSRMAGDYSLIGKDVKAYCSIRDARVVYVTLIESGENLGRLVPPRRWSHTLISFRDRALFFRGGAVQRRAERYERGLAWIPQAHMHPAADGIATSREALDIAKSEIERNRDELRADDAASSPAPIENDVGARADTTRLFSLDCTIEIDDVIIRE